MTPEAGSPSTGFAVIDRLIDGVRVGDNLVLLLWGDIPAAVLLNRFAEATRGRRPLVVVHAGGDVRFERSDDALVLDWRSLESDGDHARAEARAMLVRADEQVGEGSAFAFDSLTSVQQMWGVDAALDLFLWACPRLYRRRSIALWLLDGDAHTPSFLERLRGITQIVVGLRAVDDGIEVLVLKAAGRPQSTTGRMVRAAIEDGDLVEVGSISSERERLGLGIRDLRNSRGMNQAALARSIGVSPSALSQVERGVRGLSGETLMRIWETLGVPFGPRERTRRGYRIARRSSRQPTVPARGVVAYRLLDDAIAGTEWLLDIAPKASGRGPLFYAKTPEVVLVLHGVLDLEVGGHLETLQEGDALVATAAPIGAWTNPSATSTEVLWIVQPQGAGALDPSFAAADEGGRPRY